MASVDIHATSFQTPNPAFPGDGQVSNPSVTGFTASTCNVGAGGGDKTKSYICSGFPAPGVTPLSVTLKYTWSQDGDFGVATDHDEYDVAYSLDGGSTWTFPHDDSDFSGASNGADQIALSTPQNLTLVKVRADIMAESGVDGEVAFATLSVSDIRIEITYNAPPQGLFSSMM